MTAKRFTLAFDNYDGWAMQDTTGEYSDDEDYFGWLTGQKAVDVMNHFAEENEQLKKEVKRYGLMVNANSDLNEEIYEQLKKTENNYKSLLKENDELKKENKMLKTTIARNEEYINRITHKEKWRD